MKNKILDIKPFQEKLYYSYCGPATLKILFSYYGIDKTEKELAKISGWNKVLGIDDMGMKKAAEKLKITVAIRIFKDG